VNTKDEEQIKERSDPNNLKGIRSIISRSCSIAVVPPWGSSHGQYDKQRNRKQNRNKQPRKIPRKTSGHKNKNEREI